MKTGNKFAKHLISGVKGSAEMKHPRPGVGPNTYVRDTLLQCVLKLLLFLYFIKLFYFIKYFRVKEIHFFIVTLELKVSTWKRFKRTKEKLRQNGFLYANDSELGESYQVFSSWWRQLTPPAACSSLTSLCQYTSIYK